MNASVTARELARAALTSSIKDAARRQLGVEGPARLSVRAVAREVGLVSSAVYRYFPTRDDLLTALIIDAYDSLGAAVEAADAPIPVDRVWDRWGAVSHAVRDWALGNRHEYELIFGTPIPDYRAPQDTIVPAGRVPTVIMGVLQHAFSIGALVGAEPDVTAEGAPGLPDRLRDQLGTVTTALAVQLPPGVALRGVVAWTQLFGMVTFELFGQLVGSMDPADEFFAAAAESMGRYVGLRPPDHLAGALTSPLPSAP
ncbi:regulatory protein, tetR family [Nakamurella panacisegetis]|uniref:Regulatory protein, tetR family n=1 Tax=Nakamurella panacisegetis TaxID=1090615 RepID=A0A1H0MJA1_9ACTN|nr:TetR/AcrR family transcriptional regulator [Nakamurella panacisegetis]SDO80538.1 regulatory protein, tetR family [Nakamurella panacisegetis]